MMGGVGGIPNSDFLKAGPSGLTHTRAPITILCRRVLQGPPERATIFVTEL